MVLMSPAIILTSRERHTMRLDTLHERGGQQPNSQAGWQEVGSSRAAAAPYYTVPSRASFGTAANSSPGQLDPLAMVTVPV